MWVQAEAEGRVGMERDGSRVGRNECVWGGADTLVFDSSGGHYLREKRALMGILSSRHAQASAPSSLAAINGGEVCIIRSG